MLEGLRTVVYPVADLDAAKAWYTALLGTPPYFDQPFYVGFDVGGYELGLLPVEGLDSSTTYWGVPDADAAYAALLALGATARMPPEEVGEGIRLGSVTDPFGNVLGVIYNPHFLAAYPSPGHDTSEPGMTFSLHIPQAALEQAQAGARSASASLEEYLGECALDGIYRGYR